MKFTPCSVSDCSGTPQLNGMWGGEEYSGKRDPSLPAVVITKARTEGHAKKLIPPILQDRPVENT
jgi:hypothetical protein